MDPMDHPSARLIVHDAQQLAALTALYYNELGHGQTVEQALDQVITAVEFHLHHKYAVMIHQVRENVRAELESMYPPPHAQQPINE